VPGEICETTKPKVLIRLPRVGGKVTKLQRVVEFLTANPDWISSKQLSRCLAPEHVYNPDMYANEQLKKLREAGRLEERFDDKGARSVRLTQ